MTFTSSPDDAIQLCPRYFGINDYTGKQLYEIRVSNSSNSPPKTTNSSTRYLLLADEFMYQEFRGLIVTDNIEQFSADGANWLFWYQNWLVNSTGSDTTKITEAEGVSKSPDAEAEVEKSLDIELDGSWVFRHGMNGVWRANGESLAL
jgi:hypothetical protein